jgi:hypothetical protein
VSRFFNIPLQGTNGVSAGYTDRELYDVFAHLFGYVFLDLDPAQSFKHRVVATRNAQRLGQVVKTSVAEVKFPSVRSKLAGMGKTRQPLRDYGTQLVSRLLGPGNSTDEVVWAIIPTAAAACATQAQGVSCLLHHFPSHAWAKSVLILMIVGANDRPLPIRWVLPPLAGDPEACLV